jgi:hypothetical protein
MLPERTPVQVKKLNCKAVTAFKVGGENILSVAYELEINNGVVVAVTQLNPPNVPAASIGQATKHTWKHFREQQIEAN